MTGKANVHPAENPTVRTAESTDKATKGSEAARIELAALVML